jgi:hypothetical protein
MIHSFVAAGVVTAITRRPPILRVWVEEIRFLGEKERDKWKRKQ